MLNCYPSSKTQYYLLRYIYMTILLKVKTKAIQFIFRDGIFLFKRDVIIVVVVITINISFIEFRFMFWVHVRVAC